MNIVVSNAKELGSCDVCGFGGHDSDLNNDKPEDISISVVSVANAEVKLCGKCRGELGCSLLGLD